MSLAPLQPFFNEMHRVSSLRCVIGKVLGVFGCSDRPFLLKLTTGGVKSFPSFLCSPLALCLWIIALLAMLSAVFRPVCTRPLGSTFTKGKFRVSVQAWCPANSLRSLKKKFGQNLESIQMRFVLFLNGRQ